MKAQEALKEIARILGVGSKDVNLSTEIKLEQMKLNDGVTVIEAEVFEAGASVMIVAEDQLIALPIGEYTLEDGRKLYVEQEGIIARIEDEESEEEMPAEQPSTEQPVEEMQQEVKDPKRVVESIVKETYFEKIEELAKENEELKTKLAELETKLSKEEQPTDIVEFNDEPAAEPLVHNPENAQPIEMFKIGKSNSTMNTVLNFINK
jgi:hypothetical protein